MLRARKKNRRRFQSQFFFLKSDPEKTKNQKRMYFIGIFQLVFPVSANLVRFLLVKIPKVPGKNIIFQY